MARPLRFQYPGAVYHVMARGWRLHDLEGAIGGEATAALKRGWYLEEATFRDRLLGLLETAGGTAKRKRGGGEAQVASDHGERHAEQLVQEGARLLGMPAGADELARLRKGDERKALLASLVRKCTGAGLDWIARRLAMGHPGSVSRLMGGVRTDPALTKRRDKLEKMLKCAD